MSKHAILPKFTVGVGDRFAMQGKAQLAAFVEAKKLGIEVAPVWNKSNREHSLIGTLPAQTREEANAAVIALKWKDAYFVDADHIGLKTVDGFIETSDFFTIDVADFIGFPMADEELSFFVRKYSGEAKHLSLPGMEEGIDAGAHEIMAIAKKYRSAIREAGKIYRHIEYKKGRGNFITEVSLDETDRPQKPLDLFFILAALAEEGIPANTIAPKFSGRFNKGVDYEGNVDEFAKEFDADLRVIECARERFDLPPGIKLSVHSGSDKFSIYPRMKDALRAHGAGVHLKTAGTTWLEELIGLSKAGGEGLALVKDLYKEALARFDELRKPYATVIDVDKEKLPSIKTVDSWDGERLSAALTHEESRKEYDPQFRQLLHISFRVAAEMGERYVKAVSENEKIIAEGVTYNILERHIKACFPAKEK